MAGLKMTISEACAHPAEFMYVWAWDGFLNSIDKKHKNIIIGKRANQNKIILLSAQEYGKTREDYTNAIRQAFIDMYGVTPMQALVTLAEGGEVAGKNWNKGIYGVGSLADYRTDFVQNPSITIDKATGAIMKNGKVVSSANPDVYTRDTLGNVVASNFSYTENGVTYTSQFNKVLGNYFAGSYASGNSLQNADGKNINGSDVSSNWENGILAAESFGNWIMELLEKLGLISTSSDKPQITQENTFPSQVNDGFVSGVPGAEKEESSWGTIGLAALGATLIASGAFKKFWGKALRSKKRK